MDSVKQPLIEITDMFNKKMAAFEEELQKVSSVPSTSGTLATEFAAFKVFVLQALKSLQQQYELLAHSQDQLDMHSRRKILLLHGIPEVKNEDSTKVVVDMVKKHLKLSEFSTDFLNTCHWNPTHQDNGCVNPDDPPYTNVVRVPYEKEVKNGKFSAGQLGVCELILL
ncbi:hypothetical protein K1T71_008308 [Dendrolimus kikuchii]|uniref:Uncharacterized protein n=1 Tax=Dendrolimus kikuchii TaxID=765133 RepID=A0ACC1CWR3_9NEOP|nr:hypothetical protein K1T71_008308 [Dendrolimus kikuchii]